LGAQRGLVLIIAKKDEHIVGLDQVDPKDKFETFMEKRREY
jgi:hypothetical protein